MRHSPEGCHLARLRAFAASLCMFPRRRSARSSRLSAAALPTSDKREKLHTRQLETSTKGSGGARTNSGDAQRHAFCYTCEHVHAL